MPSQSAATIDLAYRGLPTLVLGGSGFIGAWTARALVAHGAVVTVTARDAARAAAALGAADRVVRIIVVDLSRPDEIGRLLGSAGPAVVFNLAGYGVDRSERDADQMDRLNARLVEHLCAGLAANTDDGWKGLRLVHVGSALEYGRIAGPLRETAAVNPTSEYGRTKLEGTRFVQSSAATSGLKAIVARMFTVYGPGEPPDRLLPALMQTARTGVALALTSGRQRRDFTYVEDVAEGLLRLAISSARPGEIVNLATGLLASVRDFARAATDVLGLDPGLLDFGARADLEDEMWHGDVDVSRLRQLTSWSPPTSIADGIRRSWELADER